MFFIDNLCVQRLWAKYKKKKKFFILWETKLLGIQQTQWGELIIMPSVISKNLSLKFIVQRVGIRKKKNNVYLIIMIGNLLI